MSPEPSTERVPESRNSEARIRGASDARSLPGVDGRTEEGLDPALSPRVAREAGEIRLPDPPRVAGKVERLLRPEGGNALSGAAAARGAGVRREPMAGTEDRRAAQILSADDARSGRAEGSNRDMGRHDGGRRAGLGGSPIMSADEYLSEVRGAMVGMD